MSYIGATPAESYASFYVQHFTTSATTSYALDYPVVNENDLRLVINNVVQQPGSSYAYTAAASTLTLSAATTTADTMYTVFLGRALQTVNPPADSVGGSQLADSAISGQTALGAEPADTDEFLVSDAGTLKRMDYSYIKGSGKIAQVIIGVLKTTVTSSTYDSWEDVTGISASITPAATDSKILVMVDLNMNTDNNAMFMRVVRGTDTLLTNGVGDADGSRVRVTGGSFYQSGGTSSRNVSKTILDEPSSTSSLTYKVQWYGCCAAMELFCNKNSTTSDTDDDASFRSISSITLMEVVA